MNARQKAKFFKRKYEQIKDVYVQQPLEIRYRVDRVRFTKAYPEKLIIGNQFPDIIKNDVLKGLTEQLNDYVEYKTWEDPITDTVKIEAAIKVVSPNASYY